MYKRLLTKGKETGTNIQQKAKKMFSAKQIDMVIYELYSLTDNEIDIIDGGSHGK